jgi:galactose-1-phosphate uridylyltransferase
MAPADAQIRHINIHAMAESQQLKLEAIEALISARNVNDLSIREIMEDILDDAQMAAFLPDSVCQIDPRTGDVIVYNSSRAARLHTTAPEAPVDNRDAHCPICAAKSTGVIDLQPLSEGFTFINKNLYPILHPVESQKGSARGMPLYPDPYHHGRSSYGMHLLQWTSSIHDRDWHNMPLDDCLICFDRLATLEHKLLTDSEGFMPASDRVLQKMPRRSGEPDLAHGPKTFGHVSIIKNFGHAAGASLSHGHQQIGFSNIMPQRYFNNFSFMQRNQQTFSEYMLRENPQRLMVRDFGHVVLIVPYFMKRPYDMLVLVKDHHKQYIHQLSADERRDFVKAMVAAMQAIITIMPQMGLAPAYNININNGPGAGVYLELLASTQLTGGFEHIGLWVCQANPNDVAAQLRQLINV